jgi:hypothetical protein
LTETILALFPSLSSRNSSLDLAFSLRSRS